MTLLSGKLSLTRYRVKPEPGEFEGYTDEYLSERFIKNAFVDIEASPTDEFSVGWVECMKHLGINFCPATYRFGDLVVANVRVDTRKISPKVMARYCAIREDLYESNKGCRPNAVARKEIKSAVHSDLTRRIPLTTEIMAVAWFLKQNELWLVAVGEKPRQIFESLWGRTFGLSLTMQVPVTVGLEIFHNSSPLTEGLLAVQPAPMWHQGDQ